MVRRPSWVAFILIQCSLCLMAQQQEGGPGGGPEGGTQSVAVPSVSRTSPPAPPATASHQGREQPDHAQAEAFFHSF